MEDVGTFFCPLVYFTAIWYTLWPFDIFYLWLFGIFFPVLVCCTKKNLATVKSSQIFFRFYLGHWQEGIGKLFSFGGLGVWTLVDVVLIAIRYVGPADGSLYI
jgi:hypothetical protein